VTVIRVQPVPGPANSQAERAVGFPSGTTFRNSLLTPWMPEISSARYTRTMGSWWLKSVCVVVVGALAAAPAMGMLCAVRCAVGPLPTAAAESTSPAVHHHDPAVAEDLAPAATPDVHHAAEGHHHASVSATGPALPESHRRVTAGDRRGCCTIDGQALRFLVAGRADSSIVSPPQTAALPEAAVFDASNGVQPPSHHAPPRSRSSPGYTTLVLRI
jgi:hypothetical protein